MCGRDLTELKRTETLKSGNVCVCNNNGVQRAHGNLSTEREESTTCLEQDQEPSYT